jgi:hypothetical protein
VGMIDAVTDYPVFADSPPENAMLVQDRSDKNLLLHSYSEDPSPEMAVVKTYPVPIAGFASLDSPSHVSAANLAKDVNAGQNP